MAYDKVIDSAKLKADLTTVADAIRAKGGTSEKLDFPDEYVTAVEAIESGGLDTSDATAYPYYVVAPYTFYAKGKKQTGTIEQVASPSLSFDKLSDYSTNTIRVAARSEQPMYTTARTYFLTHVPKSNFGDATASDVAKGKTFTSTAGLKVEGTYEPPVSAGGVSF